MNADISLDLASAQIWTHLGSASSRFQAEKGSGSSQRAIVVLIQRIGAYPLLNRCNALLDPPDIELTSLDKVLIHFCVSTSIAQRRAAGVAEEEQKATVADSAAPAEVIPADGAQPPWEAPDAPMEDTVNEPAADASDEQVQQQASAHPGPANEAPGRMGLSQPAPSKLPLQETRPVSASEGQLPKSGSSGPSAAGLKPAARPAVLQTKKRAFTVNKVCQPVQLGCGGLW